MHQLPDQRNFVFRSKGNLGKQIAWYVLAFCVITCIVNSINCVWVAVAGLLVPDFIYNIGTTVLNGGVSMVISSLSTKSSSLKRGSDGEYHFTSAADNGLQFWMMSKPC